MEDFAQLNIKRVKLMTKDILNQIHKDDPIILKQCKIYKDGRLTELNNIDFNSSCIFLCPRDFLGVISYYGVLHVNKIKIPDTSSNGVNSRIKTTHMTVNSPDIRFSKIEINEGREYEGIDMPESYKPINFIHKDIILWRLQKDEGLSNNEKMYRLCNQWIQDRFMMNKLNWLFYIGTEEEFLQTYGNSLNLPIYHIKIQGTIPEVITNKGGHKHLC